MKIYNGGSEKDELLKSVTGNSIPSPVKSLGNQVFVIFNTDGSAVGKGFSAIITFGTWTNCLIKSFFISQYDEWFHFR